jgi:hypothetical protein
MLQNIQYRQSFPPLFALLPDSFYTSTQRKKGKKESTPTLCHELDCKVFGKKILSHPKHKVRNFKRIKNFKPQKKLGWRLFWQNP